MNYNFEPILQRIRELKDASGYTAEYLSIKSGIAIGTLNKILSGVTTEPKLPAMIALSNVFGVSVDYIIYGSVKPKQPTAKLNSELQSLIDEYSALDARGKAAVMDTIRRERQFVEGNKSVVSSGFIQTVEATRSEAIANDILNTVKAAENALNQPSQDLKK